MIYFFYKKKKREFSVMVKPAFCICKNKGVDQLQEAQWPSGRASDSRARGRGFDPHSGRRVVSLSKIHYLRMVLGRKASAKQTKISCAVTALLSETPKTGFVMTWLQ